MESGSKLEVYCHSLIHNYVTSIVLPATPWGPVPTSTWRHINVTHGEQHGKLYIVLRRQSEFDVNGFEKLMLINLGHRMHEPLAYLLLFPYGKDGWRCALKHKDSKGNSKKISTMKFYSRLLFQRTCDFNDLIYSGRLFQQYSCEIFLKVDSERLSWLMYNQSKLRASDHTHLYD